MMKPPREPTANAEGKSFSDTSWERVHAALRVSARPPERFAVRCSVCAVAVPRSENVSVKRSDSRWDRSGSGKDRMWNSHRSARAALMHDDAVDAAAVRAGAYHDTATAWSRNDVPCSRKVRVHRITPGSATPRSDLRRWSERRRRRRQQSPRRIHLRTPSPWRQRKVPSRSVLASRPSAPVTNSPCEIDGVRSQSNGVLPDARV